MSQHPLIASLRGGDTGKLMSARQAVQLIRDGDTIHLFAVNRSSEHAAPVRLGVPGYQVGPATGELLTGGAPDTANTWDSPEQVVPVAFAAAARADGTLSFELPPLSFVALDVSTTRA